MMKRRVAMILSVLLVLCLLSSAFAESYKAMINEKSIRIYLTPELTGPYGELERFNVVKVTGTKDGIARISFSGMTCYTQQENVPKLSTLGTPARTTCKTRVYKGASLASRYTTVKKGTKVNVIETKGICAMVQKDGKIGYMYRGHLEGFDEDIEYQAEQDLITSVEDASTGAADDELPKNIEAMINAGKYSNEQICFVFATKVMGYSTAAACGLLGNISSESGFRPAADGDGGTSSGICQWHASRKTRMLNWCASHGYAPDELISQLYFLQYELEKFYPSVNKYMLNVSNNAKGAYDAAYYFCVHFECPANKETQGDKRGIKARDTYYPKYC